ncbi:MAG TPA: hypothetical protein VNU68_09815 [Verrucomicrobiae bacterium]|nr:hypothetical protein [Verrucomicrobiae bacterium]
MNDTTPTPTNTTPAPSKAPDPRAIASASSPRGIVFTISRLLKQGTGKVGELLARKNVYQLKKICERAFRLGGMGIAQAASLEVPRRIFVAQQKEQKGAANEVGGRQG